MIPELKNKSPQELLEDLLCEDVVDAPIDEKLRVLAYFEQKRVLNSDYQTKLNSIPINHTWGEQLSSLLNFGIYAGMLITIISFTSTWACGSNQSQACKDIRVVSSGIVQYWISQKPIESELLK